MARPTGFSSSPRSLALPTLLVVFVVLPLVFPAAELFRSPGGWSALLEVPRVASLAGHTLALATGAVLIAVPVGTLAAVRLERHRVPGRTALRALLLLGLFVPLPVYAAGWQAVFGWAGLADAGGWRPWVVGLPPAVWVHAVAGVPWVAGFVTLALRTADARLVDDALLAGGSRAVWRAVVWPRVRAAVFAGGCWVAVRALTESAVTDLFMVRTFAEEVYFQLVGNPAGVAAGVAVTLPVWVLAVGMAAVGLRRAAVVVAGESGGRKQPPAGVGAAGALWLGAIGLVGVPLVGLALRVGGAGQLLLVVRVHGPTLAASVLWSAAAGLVAAGFALAACWRARSSRSWAAILLVLTAAAWVTPAPLVGLGLKSLIGLLVSAEDSLLGADAAFAPLRSLLYDRPSPVPGVWAAVVRFFPVAVAVLWPVVRGVPRERVEAAALDGGRRAVWRAAVWPAVRRGFGFAVAAVTLLALGEVVATKLVQPPGWRTFAGDLFDAMHYGADATVASMCLLQVVATAALCSVFASGARTG